MSERNICIYRFRFELVLFLFCCRWMNQQTNLYVFVYSSPLNKAICLFWKTYHDTKPITYFLNNGKFIFELVGQRSAELRSVLRNMPVSDHRKEWNKIQGWFCPGSGYEKLTNIIQCWNLSLNSCAYYTICQAEHTLHSKITRFCGQSKAVNCFLGNHLSSLPLHPKNKSHIRH